MDFSCILSYNMLNCYGFWSLSIGQYKIISNIKEDIFQSWKKNASYWKNHDDRDDDGKEDDGDDEAGSVF